MNRLSQRPRGRMSQVFVDISNSRKGKDDLLSNSIQQSGNGVFADVRRISQQQDDIKGEGLSDIVARIKNAFPPSDASARKSFAGEHHQILKLANGKFGIANYAGPGTRLNARIRRGDPPRTMTDKVAQAHDLRYQLARGNIASERRADNMMVDKLSQMQRMGGLDARRNISVAKNAIKAKVFAENRGILERGRFTKTSTGKLSAKGQAVLKELEQEGFGNPADILKMNIIKQLVKENRKKKGSGKKKRSTKKTRNRITRNPFPGASFDKAFPSSSNFKVIGSGLAGRGDIKNFIVKTVIPQILSDLKVPLSILKTSTIGKIIDKALIAAKSGKINDIIKQLTKSIVPIIVHASLKHKVKGKGMAGAGMKNIMKLHGSGLLSLLAKGLGKAFRWYLKKGAKERGLKGVSRLLGGSMCGSGFGSFFKGFVKVLRKVLKPVAKVASFVAPVALPGIGGVLGSVALNKLSKVL